jgi:hypothetical protein
MPTCKKCAKGFIFYPEFGEARCSNVQCDWNLFRAKTIDWEDV